MTKPLLLVLSLASNALGSISLTIDKLDSSDGAEVPPAHLVAVDLAVDLSNKDAWRAAAIVLRVAEGSGAQFVYVPGDPNTPDRNYTAPGTERRFVTFFSVPSERDSDSRYGSEGAVTIAGSGTGNPPVGSITPSLVNIATVDLSPTDGLDGYIARIVVDLSSVTDPRFRTDSAEIVIASTPPPGSFPLFESVPQDTWPGTIVNSEDFASDEAAWGLYGIVPEPHAFLLIVVGLAAARRLNRN